MKCLGLMSPLIPQAWGSPLLNDKHLMETLQTEPHQTLIRETWQWRSNLKDTCMFFDVCFVNSMRNLMANKRWRISCYFILSVILHNYIFSIYIEDVLSHCKQQIANLGTAFQSYKSFKRFSEKIHANLTLADHPPPPPVLAINIAFNCFCSLSCLQCYQEVYLHLLDSSVAELHPSLWFHFCFNRLVFVLPAFGCGVCSWDFSPLFAWMLWLIFLFFPH